MLMVFFSLAMRLLALLKLACLAAVALANAREKSVTFEDALVKSSALSSRSFMMVSSSKKKRTN